MSKTKKVDKDEAAVKTTGNMAHQRLRRLNKRLAIAYGVQAIIVLLFASFQLYPVTIASQRLFDVSLLQIMALSLAISGTFHAIVASGVREQYEAGLRQRENPYRWLENAFSASLLPIVIAIAVGLSDIAALAMLFTLGFVTHVLGWQFERQLAAGQEHDVRRSFVLIAISSLTAWAVVGGYAVYGLTSTDGFATYGVVAYGLALVAVAGIGWVLLQFKRGTGKWRDYLYVERTLVLISFAVKSLVAWVLLAGTV